MKQWLLLALAATCAASPALAEPYIAARAGLKCMQCHVNPSGGGMRTVFGHAYAQTTLAGDPATLGSQFWGAPDSWITIGGDLRARFEQTQISGQPDSSSFDTQELRLYASAALIPGRVLLYVDQRIAPGGGNNQEAYLRLPLLDGRLALKAGKMYLPFGLRLEDDTAYIRQTSGINFETPDHGLELGYESGPWTAQAAISNGSAGASDFETGKQFSLRGAHVRPVWRLGASFNLNDTGLGTRRMHGLFGAVKTGPVVWLGEYDWIEDQSFAGGPRKLQAGLAEANWAWAKGQNLKITLEYLEPDTAVLQDEQNRYSLINEYTPYMFLQLRAGLRIYAGIPQNDFQNRQSGFVEVHGFF